MVINHLPVWEWIVFKASDTHSVSKRANLWQQSGQQLPDLQDSLFVVRSWWVNTESDRHESQQSENKKVKGRQKQWVVGGEANSLICLMYDMYLKLSASPVAPAKPSRRARIGWSARLPSERQKYNKDVSPSNTPCLWQLHWLLHLPVCGCPQIKPHTPEGSGAVPHPVRWCTGPGTGRFNY